MSFFLDITPTVNNGKGDYLKLGAVRYTLSDEQASGIPPNTREFVTTPGFSYFIGNLIVQFEVRILSAELPQPQIPFAGFLRGISTTGSQSFLPTIPGIQLQVNQDEPDFLD